jgi:molybdopterin converting factor small subunit
MFAQAREAAGRSRDEVPGATVGEVLDHAMVRYGEGFTRVLTTCKVWVNGEPAGRDDAVGPADEVAVLPPVSGGSDDTRRHQGR